MTTTTQLEDVNDHVRSILSRIAVDLRPLFKIEIDDRACTDCIQWLQQRGLDPKVVFENYRATALARV
jgi:hypothetical protein